MNAMRERIGLLLGAALALCAAASPAAAQVLAQPTQAPAPTGSPGALPLIPAPDWREGSEWQYSDGYHLRVTSTNGLLTVFERLDAPGQWFSMFGFLRQDSVSPEGMHQTIFRTVSPFEGTALNPAQPLVFRREYLKNGDLIVHASSWTVEGQEQITTPAGTFDCWIIVFRARSLTGSNWTSFERWWYAPAANNYVRMEYKYGEMRPQSRVLMRYRLSDSLVGLGGMGPQMATADQVADDRGLLWTASLVPHPIEVYPLPPLDGAVQSAVLGSGRLQFSAAE